MSVPINKIKFIKEKIKKECVSCGGASCNVCNKKLIRVSQYADAGVPIGYWFLRFEDFKGDKNFKNEISLKLEDLSAVYDNGMSFAFIGKWGVGKTYAACSILKVAISQGFSANYYTMSEIINNILSKGVDSGEFLEKLSSVDFLCIDEYDKRFVFASEKSEQMFGQTMESILRGRFSNKMPTIICSNTTSLQDVLSGPFVQSMDSLISKHMEEFFVSGKDFRKINGDN